MSAAERGDDRGRTFQTQRGVRYEVVAPSIAVDRDARAYPVSSAEGSALLVQLPESAPAHALADLERTMARAPHVLAAQEVGVLVDAETGGTSPYRGSASGGRGYALFPLLRARSMASLLTRARGGERFPPKIVLALALECARGLAATESLELLAPSSIVVGQDGGARVRGAVLEAIAASGRAREQTEGPRWLGYWAPELLRAGAKQTPAARLFALGVMLFELLAGRPLFSSSGPTAAQEIARWSVKVTDTLELGPDVPSELRSLVWSLLQRDPDRRASPQLAADLLAPVYEPDLAAGALLAPDAGLSAMFAR